MKWMLAVFLVSLTLSGYAQSPEGVVTYEKTYYWTKINGRLTYLSQEEKDRMARTYKNWDGQKSKMELFFSDTKSLYTYSEEIENTGGTSWQQSEFLIFRDFEKEKRTDVIEMLGKVHIVEDSISIPKWKILNEIKEVSGYLCMKAETQDTVKNQVITAWFAQDIPSQAGPDLYSGLPGLILELDINNGDVIITATKVDLKPVSDKIALPKKLKGKKITFSQYNKLLDDHIKSNMKAFRNPYWSIPY